MDERSLEFPWTKELKAGRIPTAIGKDRKGLCSWKAEGYQKFSFPLSECCLEDVIKENDVFELVSMIARLTELHFHTGREGWTEEMIQDHMKLSVRLNVMMEEVHGLKMCTVSLHNLCHIDEDIVNFSASDNVWCAVYERAVKHYVKKSHNSKGIEVSFAKSEARREFLKSLEGSPTITGGVRLNETKVNMLIFCSDTL